MSFDSGVSLDWTNGRTLRFLQEHLNALREVLFRAITMPNPAKRVSAKQDAGARNPERSTETFRERF
jgi:hypothetical protein